MSVKPHSALLLSPPVISRCAVLAALSVTLSAGIAADAQARPRTDGASIVRGHGRLKSEGSKEWRETTGADIVTSGTTIQASDAEPLDMMLPDGVAVTLEAGAVAEWMPGAKLPSETNHWTHGAHLVLNDGELEVKMPPAPKGAHAFLVSTKAGTLTEWRGQLHVKVQQDATAATVYEGALVVGSNGQGFPVYDGAGILMRRNVNPDKTQGIPAPPQWRGAENGLAITMSQPSQGQADQGGQGGQGRGLDLAWQPVPRADGYRIEIATDAAMTHIVERAYVPGAPEPHHASKLPATQRYFAHVRAVTNAGIVGAWSASRAVRALHFDLPPDGLVANDGTIVLAAGTSLRLEGAEGLQVAYENVDSLARRVEVPLYWSHFTGPLRAGDEMPIRIVHLRDPEAPAAGEAALVLSRRELKARVSLSPTRARWPLDPVDARIDVVDPSGHVDVDRAGVVIEAMLDLTPLPVRWQHAGGRWTGHINPRLIADPSVLRVIVKDGLGTEIGRGFLELEPADATARTDRDDETARFTFRGSN
ncbi:MAG TPA: hypothetical protein VK841_22120 [Polyangiaceae bacterium]|jgi:hypothetical protein|nr:hypothetical protein [Polyangiaceae bacterium]